MSEFQTVHDPAVPPGMVFLVPSGSLGRGLFEAPLRFREDPWPVRDLPEPAATARRDALDHLAGLLDGLCTSWGMDPDAVWRDPKIAETRRVRNAYLFRAEERLAMTLNRPNAGIHCTVP